ncbi:OprD family porin [Pseudomonas synxantha]|uniref:OprD family porin n=1 Tax=Pseudomonas synxantha TaxID=47883 RepID=A0ABS0UPS2_9PSED|nr:OprD family porin [Pseudomonas synxantha]MBI6567600.1 OprD family porin [Pseudomonas synxantha]MBI6582285.1 OprD family porin [Pseudomonas synxantha]MBI6645472.1 OprD family porin [Pseudomonas synxantha]
MHKHCLARSCALYCITPALALPGLAKADFLADSTASLNLRNFYFNRDFRQANAPQSKREEWAQAFMLDVKSGYTEGLVGLGLDVYGALGVKLDSSDARAGTGLLPNAFGDAGPGEYTDVSGVFKAKVSKTVLKVGGLMPKSPVLLSSDARLMPPLFNGAALVSQDIDKLMLDVGQFRSVNFRNASSNDADLRTANFAASSDRFNYAGATYSFTPRLTASFWRGELEDVYQQNYYGVQASHRLGKWSLDGNLGYFDSNDSGGSRAGTIDSRLTSLLVSASRGGHTWRLGYQDNHGKSALPFLQDADPNVANVVQILDFTRAGERSWQARYDYNFDALGIPGLSFFTRYLRGDDFKVAGRDGKEWERDLDVSYVIQSGALKNVAIRWRNAMVRSDALGEVDENRLILSYSIPLK